LLPSVLGSARDRRLINWAYPTNFGLLEGQVGGIYSASDKNMPHVELLGLSGDALIRCSTPLCAFFMKIGKFNFCIIFLIFI
jgi:hypothetical protein